MHRREKPNATARLTRTVRVPRFCAVAASKCAALLVMPTSPQVLNPVRGLAEPLPQRAFPHRAFQTRVRVLVDGARAHVEDLADIAVGPFVAELDILVM
jgi:hypothetical protein